MHQVFHFNISNKFSKLAFLGDFYLSLSSSHFALKPYFSNQLFFILMHIEHRRS